MARARQAVRNGPRIRGQLKIKCSAPGEILAPKFIVPNWPRWMTRISALSGDGTMLFKSHAKVANLDFEARVPVPFSIFPSTYREAESHTQTVTETKIHEEVEIKPQPEAGREGQYSSVSVTAEQVPPRGEQRLSEEEVRITREEEHYHRPGVQDFKHEEEHFTIREEAQRPQPPSQYQPSQFKPSPYQPPSQYQPPATQVQTSHTHVEIDTHRHPYYSTPVDLAEREYRQRYRPAQAFSTEDPSSHSHPHSHHHHSQDNFQANNYTVEGRPAAPQFHSEKTEINNFTVDGRSSQPQYHHTEKTQFNDFTVDGQSSRPQYQSKETEINNFTVDGRSSRPQYNTTKKTEINNFTVDGRSSQPQYRDTKTTQVNNFTVDTPVSRPSNKKDVRFSEETVETSKSDNKSKMGYYDDDGRYNSFRSGMHKLGDRSSGRPELEVNINEGPSPSAGCLQNTVSIPCHHIRLGDFLMLQGRPCQVIRISTSSATGQYRYLGVDLFTKQLHEESSFISNPAPSVVVQSMLGPVFKQYRVLDMQEGQIVAMTETGDVKQGLPVIDQSNLYSRLHSAFESGRGSVRVLVLNDGGRELAVDMKVIHGSRL
ncbi:probable woronin body major protein precursor [Fusarium torulosum]|uniref:Probable woronin body major protein n=1 Tax=Fusarium torulosum TaxID=33205 RepID=A0AAE8MII8_9HYPO|nr:probable woronin body major protein precursor [Fusarium torulosum]